MNMANTYHDRLHSKFSSKLGTDNLESFKKGMISSFNETVKYYQNKLYTKISIIDSKLELVKENSELQKLNIPQVMVTSDASCSWGCGGLWRQQMVTISNLVHIASLNQRIVMAAALLGKVWQENVCFWCDNSDVIAFKLRIK